MAFIGTIGAGTALSVGFVASPTNHGSAVFQCGFTPASGATGIPAPHTDLVPAGGRSQASFTVPPRSSAALFMISIHLPHQGGHGTLDVNGQIYNVAGDPTFTMWVL